MKKELTRNFFKLFEENEKTFKVLKSVKEKYAEKHRAYHTIEHVYSVCDYIASRVEIYNIKNCNELMLAALFHDVVYDPKKKDEENVDESKDYFLSCIEEISFIKELGLDISLVLSLIEVTKTHIGNNLFENVMCRADLNEFRYLDKVLKNANKIRKEFQWVDWDVFKKKNLEVLSRLKNTEAIDSLPNAKKNIEFLSKYMESYVPNIAIYPGTFNPFHKGHLNILEKAEKIFDKVIIAFGENPEKGNVYKKEKTEILELKYRQVDYYTGLLTDYIWTKNYPVTIIRGVRNVTDMSYEMNQYRWLQELASSGKVNLNLVSIFCDSEFEHISSSSLKTMEKYNTCLLEKYIVK